MGNHKPFLYQSLLESHWVQGRKIYLESIAPGQATLQHEAPDWAAWDQGHLLHSRIVVVKGGIVFGWAALTPVFARPVYRGVAEVSVYIGEHHRGKGLGWQLLQELIRQSEQNGIWTRLASFFPENISSIRIHKKCGFRLLGRRERIGRKTAVGAIQ